MKAANLFHGSEDNFLQSLLKLSRLLKVRFFRIVFVIMEKYSNCRECSSNSWYNYISAGNFPPKITWNQKFHNLYIFSHYIYWNIGMAKKTCFFIWLIKCFVEIRRFYLAILRSLFLHCFHICKFQSWCMSVGRFLWQIWGLFEYVQFLFKIINCQNLFNFILQCK